MNALLVILLGLGFMGCDSVSKTAIRTAPANSNNDASAEVRDAPTRVNLDGAVATLTTSFWVNVGPTMPPRNGPESIQGIVTIEALEGSVANRIARVDRVWLFAGDRVWETSDPEEQDSEDPSFVDANKVPRNKPNAASFRVVVRGGPTWDPKIPIDVVVRFVDATGRTTLLRATAQSIGQVQ